MQLRDMLRIISRGTNITFSRDGKSDGKANHHFLLMVYGLDPDTAQKAAYHGSAIS
mgnify:CR=1 FL=1